MKRRNLLLNAKLVSMLLCSLMLMFTSCKEDDPNKDTAAITSFKFVMENGQKYECDINQSAFIIINSKDSLPVGTQPAELMMTVEATPITGGTISYDGKPLTAETKIDFSKAVTITATKGGATVTYTVTAVIATTVGGKIVGDMRTGGLPEFTGYTAAFFNNNFYIFGTHYDGTTNTATARYEMYKSADCKSWTKVANLPDSLGGWGTKLVAFNNKLYGVGGIRPVGGNSEGVVIPAAKRSMWRTFSFDGTEFKDECPLPVAVGEESLINAPSGRAFPYIVVDEANGKMYARGGKSLSFGMGQGVAGTDLWVTTNGATWKRYRTTGTNGAGLNNSDGPNRTSDATFLSGGKLWIVGGETGFLNFDNLSKRHNVWSTDLVATNQTLTIWNGKEDVEVSVPTITYNEEVAKDAFEFPMLTRYGFVQSNGVLWLIGGEGYAKDDLTGATIIQNTTKFYRSTNGKTWTAVDAPSGFTGRTAPNMSVFTANGQIYIIGGQKSYTGNYGISFVGAGHELHYDVWTVKQ